MTLRAELWTRPGDAAFGKVIADLPLLNLSFSTRRNGIGDAQLVLPDSYPRLSEIYDAPDGASYGGVHSLIRIYDGPILVGELLPNAVVPQQSKGDHVVTIDATDIGSVLAYGRLEVFDWTGADDHVSLFPDWKFGAENLITDGEFDNIGTAAQYTLAIADETYDLTIAATGGTFTLTVGANTTTNIAFDATASTITTELEALASVTDVLVTTNDAGVHTIQFKDPENVSPDMTINTGGLTGGSATLGKIYDGFTKTGTTFTLTVDAQTTTALAWNASALAIENALQALSTVAEVTVEGVGTLEEPWVITFYDPAQPGSFTVNDAGLSGGEAVLTTVQAGEDSFGSWETSRFADKRVDVALHGSVSTFQLVADTIGGIGDVTALEFIASRQFGGAQTIVDVTPGATGQASVWVKSSSATARYRWVLRAVTDELDNCITGYPSCGGEFTLTANTWTELTLSNIQIPAGVEEMIFRIAYVGTVEPQSGSMRIWGATYYEGLPAGTLGYILRTLYEDIIDPHDQADPIYWDDGSGTDTPYLTLDFTDTLDSAGNAWQDDELAMEFLHEQPFLNCVTSATAKGGTGGPYIWRVVPDDAPAGTWLLQVFNPGGDPAWDLSGDDDSPVVRKGKDVVNRSARRFLPNATDVAYEAAGYQIARRRNDAAVLALGRIGGYVPDVDVPELATAGLAAEAELALRLAGSTSLAYQVRPQAGGWRPLVDYLPGYTILLEDEPLISMSGHPVDAIRVNQGARGGPTYEVHFDSESFVGDQAVAEGVRRLLAVFKGVRPDEAGGVVRGGGAVIPWLVAAANAPDGWKSVAGYVCAGSNDEATILQAVTEHHSILLSPGEFNVAQPASGYAVDMFGFGYGASIRGCGNEATFLSVTGSTSTHSVFRLGTGHSLADFAMFGGSKGVINQGSYTRMSGILFQSMTHGIDAPTGQTLVTIDACLFRLLGGIGIDVNSTSDTTITGCGFEAIDEQAVLIANGAYNVTIAGCSMFSCGEDGAPVAAITLESTTRGCVVAGNAIQNCTGHGIVLAGEHHTIDGNTIGTFETGVLMDAAIRCTVTGNTIWGGDISAAYALQVGVSVDDSDENAVHGNTIYEPGAAYDDGLGDGIILLGDSDRNSIQSNVVVPWTGGVNPTRYGVNVSAATCDDNVVADNVLGPTAAYGTAAYNDAGTGTVTARDANGQFTW